MQTGQAACGPLQTESTAGLTADDAETWDSPDPRVFGGQGKMLPLLMLRLPLLPLLLVLMLSAAGCSASL